MATKNDEITEILKLIAPGTPIRDGLENILKAKNLIVCKDIDNSQVIYNAIILLLTISFFLFLSSFFIIKQSIEPYRRLNQYLDDFLKDAMHELKTPIGVARINTDMLQMRLKNDKNILRIKRFDLKSFVWEIL